MKIDKECYTILTLSLQSICKYESTKNTRGVSKLPDRDSVWGSRLNYRQSQSSHELSSHFSFHSNFRLKVQSP